MNNETKSRVFIAVRLLVAIVLTFGAVASMSFQTLVISSLIAWILLTVCLIGAYKIYYGEKR